ncbi:hypothetical protein ACWKSP_14795 [Micromonosporaceae bacterium Da 78-11]
MGIWDWLFGSRRERFARQALRIARRTPGVQRATYDPAQYAIALHRADSPAAAWLYLANAFHESEQATGPERRERLAKLVRVMASPPPDDSWADARPKLRPVLRPVTFGLAGPAGMRPPLSRSALPHLHELVVVDQPDSMAYVEPGRLDKWGVSADEVFEAARANLAALAARSLDRPWATEQTAISMVDDGDGYFTSMLLAPGWLAGVGARMGTPLIAFAPDNNHLVLCPLPEGDVRPLYDLAEQQYKEALRSLSPVGYVAVPGGATTVYAPPAGHPHHARAWRAAAVLAATEYAGQSAWLTEQYAQGGLDVHVGRLIAVEPDDGGPAETVATWAAGVEMLLPEAQSVVFVRDEQGVEFRARWADVVALTGLRPEPLLSPSRYRVSDWPAPDIMESLRRRRLD